MKPVRHALTVDVEDWFQVLNLRPKIPRESWETQDLRMEAPTRRLLDLFDEHGAKATFFCLGWIAERVPGLVEEILARGHELASHGYDHKLLPELGHEGFRLDLQKTNRILQSISGGLPVESFRACTWSVGPETPWAFPTLVEEGFRYDSSVQPVRNADYAGADAQLGPHWLEPLPDRPLFELPPLVGQCLGRRLALGGGGYLRLLPVSWISRGLRNREKEGQPSCLYLHPWELDPDQPRVGAKGLSAFRHYVNLDKTERKLDTLLANHSFTTLKDVALDFAQQVSPG